MAGLVREWCQNIIGTDVQEIPIVDAKEGIRFTTVFGELGKRSTRTVTRNEGDGQILTDQYTIRR